MAAAARVSDAEPQGIGVWKDAFNAFQSSCRIEIEGAFGALVKRWAVLQRPLNVSDDHATLLLETLLDIPEVLLDILEVVLQALEVLLEVLEVVLGLSEGPRRAHQWGLRVLRTQGPS